MSKVRVLYHSDKTVSIIYPAPKSKRENETVDQWLKRVFDKATPNGIEYDDIDNLELPQTRENREAWEGEKGAGVFINQIKADLLKNEKIIETLIEEKKRKLAVDALINEGKIPQDFKDKEK